MHFSDTSRECTIFTNCCETAFRILLREWLWVFNERTVDGLFDSRRGGHQRRTVSLKRNCREVILFVFFAKEIVENVSRD